MKFSSMESIAESIGYLQGKHMNYPLINHNHSSGHHCWMMMVTSVFNDIVTNHWVKCSKQYVTELVADPESGREANIFSTSIILEIKLMISALFSNHATNMKSCDAP